MSTRGSLRYATCKYAAFHLYHECIDDRVYMEMEIGKAYWFFHLTVNFRMPQRIWGWYRK